LTATARLCDRDVKADGCESISIGSYDDDDDEGELTARVEVLKVLQLRVTSGVHPDPDRLASRARVRRDSVRIAGNELEVVEVLVDLRHGFVRGVLGSRCLQDSELEGAVAAELVVGRLHRALGWQEELEGAGLAGVGGGDVEVEDGGLGAGGEAVEAVAEGFILVLLVDVDDEVGEFEVGSDQVGWASRHRSRWGQHRRRGSGGRQRDGGAGRRREGLWCDCGGRALGRGCRAGHRGVGSRRRAVLVWVLVWVRRRGGRRA